MKFASHLATAALLAAGLAPIASYAQAPAVRVRGTIEKIDGNTLTVKSRDGEELKLVLKDNARIGGIVRAKASDIKPDSNVAITSLPGANGVREAYELRIAPAGQPFNSFQSDWDLAPNTMMTNGSLSAAVAGVDGQTLTVKYKVKDQPDQEQKIAITAKTIIATTVPATKADLKPGLKIFVPGAPKLPDGSLDVASIQVEKEIPPPE